MEKNQKCFLILMTIGLIVIMLTVYLTTSSISIKGLPLWTIIGVPVVILVSLFIFLLVRRKTHNIPLQKRQKLLLITLGVYIVFLLIMTLFRGTSFWKAQLPSMGMIIAIFLFAFFQKNKEQKHTEGIENKRNTESDNQNDSRI